MAEDNKIDPTLWTKLIAWLKGRLSESSTWSALVVFGGYLGYVCDPALIEQICLIGVSLLAAIQIIRKDPITAVKELKTDSSKEDKKDNK